jgi:hypothetical protein
MKKIFLAAAIVLALAGGGLLWGGTYASNFVQDNLAEQKIEFPSEEALVAQGREDLVKYADETVDTGQEAKAFASYIQGHIAKIANGQTYSEVSGQYQALTAEQKQSAEGKKLEAQRLSIFMGETLRGTLLNAYGWGFVATIALLAGAAALAAAAVAGALVALMSVSAIPTKKSKKTSKKRK